MNNFEVISRALSQNNAFMNKLNSETNNLKYRTNKLKTEITSKEDSFIILNTDALSPGIFNSNNSNELEQNIFLNLFNVSSTAKLYSQIRDYDNKIFILKPTIETIIVADNSYDVTTCTPCIGKINRYDNGTITIYLTFLISTSNSKIALFNFYINAVSDTEISVTLSVENYNDKIEAKQDIISDIDTIRNNAANYKGTVTGVKINGTTKNPSNGVVDLGTVITSHQDISGKQDKLVSGTNIKTINGESVLGSGDITIGGGASSSAYPEVNHGTGDTTFTLTPNTFHVWDEVTSLTLNFGSGISGVANEYLFQFTSGPTATSLTLPDDIKWANDNAPTIEANMIYQVSVLRGLASVLEFSNATSIPPQPPIGGGGIEN